MTIEAQQAVTEFVRAELPQLMGSRAVLAVSGGADSCAMASLIMSSGIVAAGSALAHFDHRLRGDDESWRDRRVVDALAGRLGVRIVHGAWSSPVRGEAAAREARYVFLRTVAVSVGAAGVVTGHTADDQAETVMMRLLRGSGVHGLAGMRADAALPGSGEPLRLWRPLLSLTRAETRGYCEARDITWHDDPSNGDRRYERNRVRHEVMPRIAADGDRTRENLLQLARRARAVADATDLTVRAALPSTVMERGSVRVSRQELGALPEVLLPCAFRSVLIDLLGDARDIGRTHYASFARAVAGRTGTEHRFPSGVVLTLEHDAAVLSVGPLSRPAIPMDLESPLPFAGHIGDWHIRVTSSGGREDCTVIAPAAAVVRRRRPGDRLRPRGMGGRHRKLQDVLVDRKVPRRLRDATPVIAAGSDVLWTPYTASELAESGEPYRVSVHAAGATGI